MPWQRLVVDVGLEIDPETGLPAYRELIITVMRQNGKTALFLAMETERCTVWKEKQRVIYTAQTGTDARDKLLEDQVPVLESKMARYIRRVYRAKGEEAVSFVNGSRIQLAASSEKSGHGATIDLGVLDECWADDDNRREQSIVPMMNTRPAAQLILCSTQGTERSVYLNRKTEIGRAAAKENKGSGIAYFEWSIPEDEDIENPEIWWEYMPALGWTIQPNVVAHALRTMDESEWRRAYGNQPTKSMSERIIPVSLWEAVNSANAMVERSGLVYFAVDVLPDRASASIAASDGKQVELVDHRSGTGWVVERVKSLMESWNARVVVDGGGPAASIADDLTAAGVDVERMSNAEVAAACASMYDAIADQKVQIRSHPLLDEAVGGLAKRPVGDRFIWSRSASQTDITPFMALTLAYERALHAGTPTHVVFYPFA